MLKDFARRPAVQALLAWAIAAWLSFALRTTRWTIEGDDEVRAVAASGRAVAAFWHETLPLMPALFRHARRAHPTLRATALASRHHDGRLLGEIMRALGTEVVHGSSRRDGRDRGGAARRRAAGGVAQLAGISGAPVLPCGAMMRHCVRLGTWDRMMLPLPFGRGAIVCGAPIDVPREGWAAALPGIEAAITAATARAEALCR
ncbi:MAG: DUF374 domain-containing protein [Alphaproteobacteria bacterium]|nr:DUF374 domain-containing protein [Alphaproteobacteria bacterium]